MIHAIKSEFRKLITVRSTYFLLGFVTLIILLFAFYIEGYKTTGAITDPNKLSSEVTNGMLAVTVFGALAGVLLMSHEYRYNTIIYTLTAAKSRLKALFAKVFVISIFAILFSLAVSILSPLATYVGLQLKGVELVHQDFPIAALYVRAIFYGWGYAMLALLIATFIRSQLGAVAGLFLLPVTIEPLLGLLLKENAAYLPFNALNTLMMKSQIMPAMTHADAAVSVLVCLGVGWLIAGYLFVRRDAV